MSALAKLKLRTRRRVGYHRAEPIAPPPPARVMQVVTKALAIADKDPTFRPTADRILEQVSERYGCPVFDLRCWAAATFRTEDDS